MHWIIDWLDYYQKRPIYQELIRMAFAGRSCEHIRIELGVSLRECHRIIRHIHRVQHFRDFTVNGIDTGRLFRKWGTRGMNDPMF